MPEGAEVQVIVDGLQKYVGRTISSMVITPLRPWVFSDNSPSCIGDPIVSIDRIGKFIVINHKSSNKTVIHLSFTGSFLEHRSEYLALELYMDDGNILYFHDRRGLAKWKYLTSEQFDRDPTLKAHKVDALSSSKSQIFERLKELQGKKVAKELKPLLLDYHYICGIGNIYASEICFEAKIPPTKIFADCSDADIQNLSIAIPLVLRRAYQAGGSSIESFTSLKGKSGQAQKYHKVYDRGICAECGSGIVAFKQAGRTTYYCPACQKGA